MHTGEKNAPSESIKNTRVWKSTFRETFAIGARSEIVMRRTSG